MQIWVVRNSWGQTMAKVIDINGAKEGERLKGKSRYFNNPMVKAEFYKMTDYLSFIPEAFENRSELKSPGTFSYSLIELDIE